MVDVTIIIVNYNTFELTCNCLKSVIKESSGFTYEIILVDNASTECDVDEFKKRFPQVNLIKSNENLGFSKGNNLGIKYSHGKNILLLNSDTILIANSIKYLNDYLNNNLTVGAVSPRIIYPNGISQSVAQRFPSIKYSLIELLRLHKFFTKERRGEILLGAFFNNNKTIEVDWIWGTCFLFKAEILKKMPMGKLDDMYFMYCEDMQWCMDIRNIGYKIFFYSDTQVVHLMGGSSGNKNKLMLQNNKLFLKRNYNYIHYHFLKLFNYLLNFKW